MRSRWQIKKHLKKIKNHKKDDIPNVPNHLHISDPNLL